MNFAAELLETLDAAEVRQSDHEGTLDEFGAHLAQEFDRRLRGSSRRDQIVDQQNLLTGFDRADVHLDPIASVFEIEISTDRFPGQLARLSKRHESDLKLIGDGGPEDESSGFDADDEVEAGRAVPLGDSVDCEPETNGIQKKRRDVSELDSGFRVIGNRANEFS